MTKPPTALLCPKCGLTVTITGDIHAVLCTNTPERPAAEPERYFTKYQFEPKSAPPKDEPREICTPGARHTFHRLGGIDDCPVCAKPEPAKVSAREWHALIHSDDPDDELIGELHRTGVLSDAENYVLVVEKSELTRVEAEIDETKRMMFELQRKNDGLAWELIEAKKQLEKKK